MKIPVPEYLLKRLIRNYLTLAERGTFDRTDTKVANALRTRRADTERLRRIMSRREHERE